MNVNVPDVNSRMCRFCAGEEPASKPAADLQCYSQPVVDDVWSGQSKSALTLSALKDAFEQRLLIDSR